MTKVLDISGLGNRTYLPDGAPREMLGSHKPKPCCFLGFRATRTLGWATARTCRTVRLARC